MACYTDLFTYPVHMLMGIESVMKSLCDLVVGVPSYRSRSLGFDSRRYQLCRRGFLIDSPRVASSVSFNSSISMSDVVFCVANAVAVYRLFAHMARGMNEEAFDLPKISCYCCGRVLETLRTQ
jgi:hypothetical protein